MKKCLENASILLKYGKIKKHSSIVNRLFGMSIAQFDDILQKNGAFMAKKVIGGYKRSGRDYKLDLLDMVLMLLLYYRSYVRQIFVV